MTDGRRRREDELENEDEEGSKGEEEARKKQFAWEQENFLDLVDRTAWLILCRHIHIVTTYLCERRLERERSRSRN